MPGNHISIKTSCARYFFFQVTNPFGLKLFSISLAPFLIFVQICFEVAEEPFCQTLERVAFTALSQLLVMFRAGLDAPEDLVINDQYHVNIWLHSTATRWWRFALRALVYVYQYCSEAPFLFPAAGREALVFRARMMSRVQTSLELHRSRIIRCQENYLRILFPAVVGNDSIDYRYSPLGDGMQAEAELDDEMTGPRTSLDNDNPPLDWRA